MNTRPLCDDHFPYWQIGEEELTGPDGTKLLRVPGHIAYWFAWNGYLGAESEVYSAKE